MTVFNARKFTFPYHNLSFPGQHSEERILFVTREGKQMLTARWISIGISVLFAFVIRSVFLELVTDYYLIGFPLAATITFWLNLSLGIVAVWWVQVLWKKSVFIITTRRLTKFIHTTPWNRYQLSLGLDKIVDTGAYQKGFFQSLTHLGYFVARSSAGNIKNFKIVNIGFAEDLHNYVNKLLFLFNKEQQKLDTFRPFIPNLKGEARERYVDKTAPQYGKNRTVT